MGSLTGPDDDYSGQNPNKATISLGILALVVVIRMSMRVEGD